MAVDELVGCGICLLRVPELAVRIAYGELSCYWGLDDFRWPTSCRAGTPCPVVAQLFNSLVCFVRLFMVFPVRAAAFHCQIRCRRGGHRDDRRVADPQHLHVFRKYFASPCFQMRVVTNKHGSPCHSPRTLGSVLVTIVWTACCAFLLFANGTSQVGWVFQFVGHWFEGKKPAFFDGTYGLNGCMCHQLRTLPGCHCSGSCSCSSTNTRLQSSNQPHQLLAACLVILLQISWVFRLVQCSSSPRSCTSSDVSRTCGKSPSRTTESRRHLLVHAVDRRTPFVANPSTQSSYCRCMVAVDADVR